MTQRHGFKTIIVYFIGETKEECQQAFLTLLQLAIDLGFQISWHKVIGPTQKLVFLGVELDTASCEMAIPPIKLMELHHVVTRFLFWGRESKKQIQQLAGKLNWACRVVESFCDGSLT